jgi:hypothetical protein
MKHLLYCIFSPADEWRKDIARSGIDGAALAVVTHNGLAAIISDVVHNEISQDSANVLAYHKVIESFHDRFGVIPIRFGTVVEKEEEVKRLLEQQGDRYRTLLNQLDGCVEMGVRIIVDDLGKPAKGCCESSASQLSACCTSGAAYLADRKAHQDAEALADERDRQVIDRYRSAFEGLFIRFKTEKSRYTVFGPLSKSFLLSFCFLIPRHAVKSFRMECADLSSRDKAKMMFSGPWPPYNFVLPEDY